MIDINVVPKQLRRKRKKTLFPGGFQIPKEIIFGMGGGLVVLLIFVHIFLQVTIFVKLLQHQALKNEWNKILPSKENVDNVVGELRALQTQVDSIQKITNRKEVLWSQKLNIISDVLPRGVWLKKIALTEEMLFIEGSAIIQKNNQTINIHAFATSLKKDKNFMTQLGDLEVGSIQSRKIQQLDVDDFVFKAKIKD